MVNNKNSKTHQQCVEHTSPRGVVSQKNMDTLRVLSNIRIPNVVQVSNEWSANSGYMTEEYKNNCQQSKNIQQDMDIIDAALSAAINEENKKTVMEEFSNISVPDSLLQALSPWEVDLDAPNDVKWASTSNSSNNEKTKKSRRQSMKETHSKKQKIKEAPTQLKTLLLHCDSKKDKSKCVKRDVEPVIILSDSDPRDQENIEIFSQDSDMAIFKQAIELKRTLISDMEAAERELNVRESDVARLREELAVAEKDVEEIRRRKDNLTKKVDWVLKSL